MSNGQSPALANAIEPAIHIAGQLGGAVALFRTVEPLTCVWSNSRFRRLTKRNARSLGHITLDRFLETLDCPYTAHSIRQIVSGQQSFDHSDIEPTQGATVLRISSGEGFLVLVQLPDHDDPLQGDHSGRLLTELADAVERETRLRLVFDATNDMVFDVDLRTQELRWSDVPQRQLGLVPGAPMSIGQFVDLIHPEDRGRVQTSFQIAKADGSAFNTQYRIRHQDGSYRTWRSRGRVMYSAKGDPIRFLGAHSDLTDIMTTRERLATKSREAEDLQKTLNKQLQINAVQRTFISMVSHEFRTPLTVIQGLASQVRRRAAKLGPDDIMDRMETVEASVSRLVDLIETILSSAQIEDGKIRCRPVQTDLANKIAEMVKVLGRAFPKQNFAFRQNAPALVVCDPVLMQQVISNLITNAAKYSPNGSQIDVAIASNRDGSTTITVSDNGPGIPEAEVAMLFERFFRASTARTIPGTGIGLNLVKHFVDLHGGEVTVDSVVGKGSTFRVQVPQLIAGETRLVSDAMVR